MQARKTLAENIRALAKAQGIAVTHLADRAGVSRAMMFRVLAETSAASTDWLESVAKALDVEPSELLKTRAKAQKLPKAQRTIDSQAQTLRLGRGGSPMTVTTSTKEKTSKKPVTERAIVQRINRALADHDQQVLKASRGRAAWELGPWYMINTAINGIMFHYKNMGPAELEALAKHLGVIKPWEKVEG